MLSKIKKIHNSINLIDLNNILLCISLITIAISLIKVSNLVIVILVFLFIYGIAIHLNDNKIIRFLTDVLGILVLSYFLIYFIDTSFVSVDIKNGFLFVIKVLSFISYFFITFHVIKNKNLKVIKGKKINIKNYTFKELRSSKINGFRSDNIKIINNYINDNEIDLDSDYYKVINDNLNNKSKNDLEEYVWINYLRFYKNKKYNKTNIFDKFNFIFILIHVIILLLAIFVK